MRQVNIVGTSPPSQPSRKIQTLQAPPDMAPANVTLRTASETSLWLRWMVRPPRGQWGWDGSLVLVTLPWSLSPGDHIKEGGHQSIHSSLRFSLHPAPLRCLILSLGQKNKSLL